jgi:hypothetical protein
MKGYGGFIMPSADLVKKDLEALGTAGQEEILNYLEEVMVILFSRTSIVNKV